MNEASALSSPAIAARPAFAAIALGVFDALHVGHGELVRRLRDVAAGGDIALITFDPHPRTVLFGAAPARILQPTVRDEILDQWGVHCVVTIAVDRELLAMTPEEFLRGLSGCLRYERVLVGANFRFGRARAGNIETLRAVLGADAVIVVPPVEWDGELVSATRVRGVLAEGDLAAARELLGRDYEVRGAPARGDGLGKRLGSPTINLEPTPAALPDGVYAVRSVLGDGVVHLGPRPTLDRSERRFELHLFAVPPEELPKEIAVRFVARLREVYSFPDVEALKRQVAADIAAARVALGGQTATLQH